MYDSNNNNSNANNNCNNIGASVKRQITKIKSLENTFSKPKTFADKLTFGSVTPVQCVS